MCIGIPFEILEPGAARALARSRQGTETIDMRLLGEVPAGTHVLVMTGVARQVLDPDEARRIDDALEAVRLALKGETDLDHLFADLAGREPELPAAFMETQGDVERD